MNVDQVLSKASLDSLGCKLWMPMNGDVLDYSGNSVSVTPSGVTYTKQKNGRFAAEFTSGDTLSWSDIGTIGTKICWKDTGSGWEFDDNPTFISSTGVSGYIGKLMNIIIFSDTLTTEQKNAFHNATYIE